MNNLSWALYLADVVQNFKTWLSVPSIVVLFLIASFIVFVGIYNSDAGEYDKKKYPSRLAWTLAPVALFVLLVASLIPSKQTILLIAGSEVGEKVISSPEAQEMFNDIREVIKTQLKELKKE